MRSFKIAIFGNINNYPLLLALGLRGNGHDVRLFVNRKELLHRPEGLYPGWRSAYPSWIYDCSFLTDVDIARKTSSFMNVASLLNDGYDFVVLNDTGPAFASVIKCPYAAVLTGSDLSYYADFKTISIRSQSWSFEFRRSPIGRGDTNDFTDLIARQRDGILGAELICYPEKGLIPSGDELLHEIGVRDQDRMMLYFSNTLDLEPQPFVGHDFAILSGSRVVFREDRNPGLSAIDFKGTDLLLEAFAAYCHLGGKGTLKLVKKGPDVECAVDLIHELKIDRKVVWLDEMSLSNFHREMSKAALVCDQFGTSFPGMVTADAMALGKPVVANFRKCVFSNVFAKEMPGFDATTSEQICNHFIELERNKVARWEVGKASREFAERFLSPKVVAAKFLKKLAY